MAKAEVVATGAGKEGFDDLATAHDAALESATPDLRTGLSWAGKTVNVHVTGRSLARLLRRPLEHLVFAPDEALPAPELSVCLSESGDTPLGRVLRGISGDLSRTWSAPDLDIRSSTCGRMVGFVFGPRSSFLLDRKKRILVGTQDPERLALFERTKPLLLPLRVLLQDMGVLVVHAGLVADQGNGFLIAGPEKVGKSSAAVRCFVAGFDLLGDDQAAISSSGQDFVGHSLYSAVQVRSDWLSRLGSFPPRAMDRDPVEDKIGLFLAEVAPERLRRSVPIRAIALPRLCADQPSRVVPATKAEALMRIAPSTLFQPLGAGTQGVRLLRRLIERTPSYWIYSGRNESSIPELLRRLSPESRRA